MMIAPPFASNLADSYRWTRLLRPLAVGRIEGVMMALGAMCIGAGVVLWFV